MSDLKINGAGIGTGPTPLKTPGTEPAEGFENLVHEAMTKLSQVQTDADKAVQELSGGGNPTEAIIAMEKADMNFQLMIEVRNKLISAYQEVMRMQI